MENTDKISASIEHSTDEENVTSVNDNISVDDDWLDILGSGHIKKKILVPGKENTRPQRGDICVIDLSGFLENGTVFEEEKNFEVCIGDAEVIQGIDYSLPLMDVGETSKIIITSRFGYGDHGRLPEVQPGATLTYTVSLLEIKEEDPMQDADCIKRLNYGLKKKERGNWWFQRKEYQLAIQCYRKALSFLEDSTDNANKNEELCEERLKTYNNLTIAQLKIEAYDAALTSVDHVLAGEPQNIKAIYRKVKILRAKGDIDEAINIAKEGLQFKSDSAALQETLNGLIESKQKSISAQKVLYRKMFQNCEKSDNNKNKSSITFVWKWFGIFTIAVGVISAVAIKYRS